MLRAFITNFVGFGAVLLDGFGWSYLRGQTKVIIVDCIHLM